MTNKQDPNDDLEFFLTGLIITGFALSIGLIAYLILNISPWISGFALFLMFAVKFVQKHRPK